MRFTIMILISLFVSAAYAEDRHCALIGASFSSGTRPTANGQWPILSELRLETTINAITNPVGVYVHSHAVGGSDPAGLWRQWEEVKEQAALPGSAPLECMIVGLSGSVVADLYGTMTDILALAQNIRETGVRVIMLGYPPVARIGQNWLDDVGIPGLAKQGWTLADYESARVWYAEQARLVADSFVSPWNHLEPIADGLHPNWRSAYRAAIDVAAAVVNGRVFLP